MPLYPGGGPRVGLGLWNHVAATLVTEIAMLGVGVWMYARVTRARDGIGRYAFFAYVFVLLLLFVGDRFSTAPPTVSEIVGSGIVAEVVLLLWPWWFDRHREARPEAVPGGGKARV